MINLNIDQWASTGRTVLTFAGGLAAGVGVISVGGSADLMAGWDHIVKGLNEIAIGVGTITPVIMGAWGVLAHSNAAKIVAAAAVPEVKNIVISAISSPEVSKVVNDPAQPKVTRRE